MPGLLEQFRVSSDTEEQLGIAVRLPFFFQKQGASHYVTGFDEGAEFIRLQRCADADSIRLPFALTTPEEASAFLCGWLRQAKRGPKPDIDGSLNPGWLLTQDNDWRTFIQLQAVWIAYHK